MIDDWGKVKPLTLPHILTRVLGILVGLKNDRSTVIRVMETILSPGRWQFALIYLDDVIIFFYICRETSRQPTNCDETIVHSQSIIGMKECFFCNYCIDYLGYVVEPDRLEVKAKSDQHDLGLQHFTNGNELK